MCQRMNTLARLREVSAATRGASVVLLVSDRDRHVEQDAFAAGAHAVFNRDARAPALGTLIAEIAHGRLMLAPRVVAPHISSAAGGVNTAGAVVGGAPPARAGSGSVAQRRERVEGDERARDPLRGAAVPLRNGTGDRRLARDRELHEFPRVPAE